MSWFDDVSEANRLIAFGFQPGKRPPRYAEYRALVERYHADAGFAQLVQAALRGFDLTVIAVDHRAGIVLGPTPETPFAASVADHVPNLRDRPLVLLAHLAIAALGFPRAADLDDDTYVGRVCVDQIDEVVTAAAEELNRRAIAAESASDPPAGQPELVQLWRYYLRRNSVGRTGDTRALFSSRRALIKKAAEYLADHGMLRRVADDGGGTYSTTIRYQIQVRELASQQMLSDLAALGIAVASDGSPALRSRPDADQLPT